MPRTSNTAAMEPRRDDGDDVVAVQRRRCAAPAAMEPRLDDGDDRMPSGLMSHGVTSRKGAPS